MTMFKKLAIAAATVTALVASPVLAAGGGGHVENVDFSFDGPFGTFDQNQLQRGLKVYTEICSSCHGLRYVSFRTLADEDGPGFSEDQMKAYTAEMEVWDPSLNDGEGDYRQALSTDHFPSVTSQDAPDLSLMAKGRAGFHGPYGLGLNQLFFGMGGPDYIASLLTGYEDPPSCAPADFDGNYNTVFAAGGYPDECKDEDGNHMYPGSWIAMGQPLYGEDVDFDDGHSNVLHHEAEDVAAFLMWTAEPKMMARKRMGFTAVLLLGLLSVLLYLTNKKLWAPVKARAKE